MRLIVIFPVIFSQYIFEQRSEEFTIMGVIYQAEQGDSFAAVSHLLDASVTIKQVGK